MRFKTNQISKNLTKVYKTRESSNFKQNTSKN